MDAKLSNMLAADADAGAAAAAADCTSLNCTAGRCQQPPQCFNKVRGATHITPVPTTDIRCQPRRTTKPQQVIPTPHACMQGTGAACRIARVDAPHLPGATRTQ